MHAKPKPKLVETSAAPMAASEYVRGAAIAPREFTRTQAARILGVSVGSVRRLEKRGELKPRLDTSGAQPTHLFASDELFAFQARQRVTSSKTISDGADAARVFAMLESHVHPVNIVTQLEIHPDVVETLVAQWSRMRGSVIVRAEELRRFEALEDFVGELPMADGATLVRNIATSLDALRARLVARLVPAKTTTNGAAPHKVAAR